MKKIFSILLFSAIISQALFAQNNNLIVYSQDGFKFSVILNGIRQNSEPQTNVKVTGLNATNYQIKIIFDNKMPDLDQNAYLMDGGEPTQNTEYTYAVAKVNEKYKLRFKSAAPVSGNAIIPQQTVVIYTPVERVTQTTTTTTNSVGRSTNGNNGNNANIGMNVNGEGMGINMNINVNDMDGGMSTGTSSTTTTYSTSTTTTTSSNSGDNDDHHGHHDGNHNDHYILEGYNGEYGCPYPMGEKDFESAKSSIKSKSFDDSKLTLAKQIIGSNCMLCSQIKELMLLITFEQTRLDLAKFAWSHNLDRGNYYKLNDAFTFESSIDELNKYTQSH